MVNRVTSGDEGEIHVHPGKEIWKSSFMPGGNGKSSYIWGGNRKFSYIFREWIFGQDESIL